MKKLVWSVVVALVVTSTTVFAINQSATSGCCAKGAKCCYEGSACCEK